MNHSEHSAASSHSDALAGNELFQFPVHSRRRSHWPVFLALLALAGAAGLFLWIRSRRPESLPVILARQPLTHTPHRKLTLALDPARNLGWYSERDQPIGIWSLDFATGQAHPLASTSPENSLVQSVSPNGQRLLATRFADHAGQRVSDLWEMDLASGQARLLVPGGWSGAWSPDGSQLIYSLWNHHGIYRAGASGSHAERIAQLPGYPWYLHWSPDAKRILAISIDTTQPATLLPQGRLYRVITRTGRTRLIQDDSGHAVTGANPYYSRDRRHILLSHTAGNVENVWEVDRQSGHMLAITSNRVATRLAATGPASNQIITAEQDLHARLMQLPTGSHRLRPFPGPLESRDFAFSRDGRWVAYIDLNGALCRARADGSQSVRLLDPSWNASQPAWAPDSRQLIVSALPHGGLKKLYRLLAIGDHPHPQPNAITFGMGTDRDPNWSADQKHVLFRRTISGLSQLEWLNLDSGQLQIIPGSQDKFDPVLSSTGVIAALDRTGHTLFLRHGLKSIWEEALRDPNGMQHLLWSRDGTFLLLASGSAPSLWKRFDPRHRHLLTVADIGKISPWRPNHPDALALDASGGLVVSYDISGSNFYLLTLGSDQ